MDENTTNQGSQITENTQRELQQRFQLLPEDLQKTIKDSNYTQALFEISKENKLTYEQLETLQLETIMAFMGMNNPQEYREFLQGSFHKTDAEMDVLISAINSRVFDPVKESLHKLYSTNEDSQTEPDDIPQESIGGEPLPAVVSTPAESVEIAPKVSEPVYTPAPTPIPINVTPSVSAQSPMQQYVADPVMPKVAPVPAPALTSTETNVLGNAGVVLGESQNRMGDASLEEAALPDRNALMDGIENPTPTPRPTIMANKLTMSTTLMPGKTTDYSLPKTSAPASTPIAPSAQKPTDPYREAV